MATMRNQSGLEALIRVIAHSQIVTKQPDHGCALLPEGFDATDVAILDWIIAEARRGGRTYLNLQ